MSDMKGVWVIGYQDHEWEPRAIFPGTPAGELEARRILEEIGGGQARFVRFGQMGQMS